MIEKNKRKENGDAPDAVSSMVKASWIKFNINQRKGIGKVQHQELIDCRLTATYEDGVVCLSLPSKAVMVSVRIDEMMSILYEASAAAKEYTQEEEHGE